MAHAAQQHACWCSTCRPVVFGDMRMVLCPECGNKRCPRATDHRNACSGSNELGQAGSAYTAHLAPQRIINGATMTNEELDAIANREAHCKPFGAAVTLSVGERDALVAMARRYAWLRDSVLVDGEINATLFVHVDSHEWPDRWALVGDELDAAVDAAMAKEQACEKS